MAMYLVGVMVKIALEDKDTKNHREDFNRIVKEVEEYRQLHRGAVKETNAFAFDGLWYRVNRG
jgi:predicted Ser/Thr protein kinase